LFLDIVEDHGLYQHVRKPTRGPNILDLLLTTNPDLVEKVEVCQGMSDHNAVISVLNVKARHVEKPPRKVYLFQKMNTCQMKTDAKVFMEDFKQKQNTTNQTDVNSNWQDLKSCINDMLDKHVPQKAVKQRWDVPWMTREVKRLIRKKRRIYNMCKKYDTISNWTKFKKIRKTVQKCMQRAKNDYLMSLLEQNESNRANDEMNPSIGKKFWTHVKSVKRDGCGIATLCVDGVEISSDKGKAQALNDQYYSVFTTENLSNIPNMEGTPFPTIDELVIIKEGVQKLLHDINTRKASGPDGIPSHVLKELSEEFAPVICTIFQQSLDTGTLPEDWLSANITAIFKKGDKSKPSNYRPVSLTSVTSKLLEHIIFHHIMSHIDRYHILSHFQHGFRSGHSCESQLIITIEDLVHNLDNHYQTDLQILDFQKAFDVVPHRRLLLKLDFYGVRGNLLKFIEKWLTSRKQRVVVNGEASNPANVKSGIPQGTVLGPLMFLLYINDIADHIDSGTKIRLFADDCLLYRIIRSPHDSDILQKDLHTLCSWAHKWQMRFNTSKCKTLRVTTKKKTFIHTYTMDNDELECVTNYPYLGVEISHNLKWNIHISSIVAKANKALWFLRRNLWRCPQKIKEQLYFALVRSILEYACAVWDPFTISNIQSIEMIQHRAARFVTKDYSRTEGSITRIMDKLKWPTLESRRKQIRLTTMFKIQNQSVAITTPEYIQRQVASTTRQYHPAKYRIMKNRTDTYKYSFWPRTISEWNSLPHQTLDISEKAGFKAAIGSIL
jgi:hypothetical protein